jgi:hypothetical protein
MMNLEQIGPVLYGEPVNGIAPIVSIKDEDGNEVLDRDVLEESNRRVRAVGEFRLEHARQTDYGKYLRICRAREIKPDPHSPPPPHYTGNFQDWPV